MTRTVYIVPGIAITGKHLTILLRCYTAGAISLTDVGQEQKKHKLSKWTRKTTLYYLKCTSDSGCRCSIWSKIETYELRAVFCRYCCPWYTKGKKRDTLVGVAEGIKSSSVPYRTRVDFRNKIAIERYQERWTSTICVDRTSHSGPKCRKTAHLPLDLTAKIRGHDK